MRVEPVSPRLSRLSVGVELFDDFGWLRDTAGCVRQGHQIGPIVKASFHNGAYIQVGYRAGLSEQGADHVMTLFVGRRI